MGFRILFFMIFEKFRMVFNGVLSLCDIDVRNCDFVRLVFLVWWWVLLEMDLVILSLVIRLFFFDL